MAFPVAGAVAQMQSNMAATLNIDWIVDIGRDAPARWATGRPQGGAEGARCPRARGQSAAAIYHPYILEAGERGPFIDANARAQFIGLTHHIGFIDLMRAVYEGLVLAARDCYAAMGRLPRRSASPAARRARKALSSCSPARWAFRCARARAKRLARPAPR